MVRDRFGPSHTSDQPNDTLRLKHGEPVFRSQSRKAVSCKQWNLDFLLPICPLVQSLYGRQEVLDISPLQLASNDFFMPREGLNRIP